MNTINWVEWIGYIASTLILISLLMTSIVKLRLINLVGALIFAIYGFLIGAIPVAIANIAIIIINIYYLTKLYAPGSTTEFFKVLAIDNNSPYFKYFLDFYETDILSYFPNHSMQFTHDMIGFYVLRDLVPAGIFIGSRYDENTLLVELDFAIPEYRDLKIGKYLYEEHANYFLDLGYTRLISHVASEKHTSYLHKMGFMQSTEGDETIFVKHLL
ncbi:conserved hypothetical protein [Alkaliphilus metalliredigens QYMF]|uniref:N-acetyltransferase domain-containing protein n=1 Tax=Alkaliphilus metalliredigens (strain QYMF) TaxID=293826 RepID=A6TVV1_ALKMQ|nr:YgjV family protein [Alkaliphilus metalliredigens]ABR50319.1 conserved hypothetical protein [Alkaliphilus metalliredigens QYMF]